MNPISKGERFASWVAIEDGTSKDVLCECSCGTKKIVRNYALRAGRTRSCYACSRKSASLSNTRPLAQRFWSKVDRRGPDECWPWTGHRNPHGYGRISVEGRPRLAHRVSVVLANGTVADGLEVCHTCDNPPCVNPAHLFLGTHSDNMADMDRKGRRRTVARSGSSGGAVKVSDAVVTQVIAAIRSGGTQRDVARRFGVSQAAASEWVRGVKRGAVFSERTVEATEAKGSSR